jgi:putative intracellular protease/amidase
MAQCKKALVFLAEGAEEMEAVICVDLLRRGQIEVLLANVNEDPSVICSRNVRIVADVSLESVKNETFDALIVPGGLERIVTHYSLIILDSIVLNYFVLG